MTTVLQLSTRVSEPPPPQLCIHLLPPLLFSRTRVEVENIPPSIVFPGHYANRVTHFHLVAQANITVLTNGTYIGGVTKHIGQLYFDDALVKQVEATEPYASNTVAYTTPTEDGWMLEEATTDYDPFVDYVQLTDDIADGLLAWITVGVNVSANHSDEYDPAAHYYAGGGVTVEDPSMGSGPSNPCAVGPGTTPTCTITPTDETLPVKLKY